MVLTRAAPRSHWPIFDGALRRARHRCAACSHACVGSGTRHGGKVRCIGAQVANYPAPVDRGQSTGDMRRRGGGVNGGYFSGIWLKGYRGL